MGSVRIIGGKWRGRKLPFPDLPELRPTPDRVRETLFNWLQPDIEGAVCLDLFAGTGALGLEALSRGAKTVTMVEKNKTIISNINKNIESLGSKNVILNCQNSLSWLEQSISNQYNIVFLDPPFRQQLMIPCCTQLEKQGLLAQNAKIYLELEVEFETLSTPFNWELLRQKRAGQVNYFLFNRVKQ